MILLVCSDWILTISETDLAFESTLSSQAIAFGCFFSTGFSSVSISIYCLMILSSSKEAYAADLILSSISSVLTGSAVISVIFPSSYFLAAIRDLLSLINFI
jgi:hypothetical protein